MEFRRKVFDTYWKTVAERQEIFFRKIEGVNPLTLDPIFLQYKFCNVYRAADRVSQFLIKKVIYDKERNEKDTIFRILFFRLLNKVETWEELEKMTGEINLKNYNFENYSNSLIQLKKERPIYGGAFILCANKVFGYEQKHQNHLKLLELIFGGRGEICQKILASKNLKSLYGNLRELPLLGNFMAYQIAIDLNYSTVFNFDENEFCEAGPGAVRGIEKCFVDCGEKSPEEIIYWMVENQEKEFERLGLDFRTLWGRPMKAIDIQNWFCETDKYCRVLFPALKSNRSKIKAEYKPSTQELEYFFPPKWKLNTKEGF